VVFERQRQAARLTRAACKRDFLRVAETSAAPPISSQSTGEEEEEGEGGSTIGGGWRYLGIWGRRRSARHDPATCARPLRTRPPEDALFFETLSAAARVCHGWRELAFGAADRLNVFPSESNNVPSSSASRDGPWQRDVLSVLRASKSGALRGDGGLAVDWRAKLAAAPARPARPRGAGG
jgi:hypothetical protein